MSGAGRERPTWPQWLSERLRAQLGADERLVAEGRLRGGGYVVVTDRRLISTEGRRVVSLSFAQIVRAQEIFEDSHRYRLRLLHEPIDRSRDQPLPWDIPHHIRRWRDRKTWNRTTELRFSRSSTQAAEAIREGLSHASAIMLEPVVRPHRRDESDGTL